MKVSILCSDYRHPVFPYLEGWMEQHKSLYQICLLNAVEDLIAGGDILFLVSCSEIVPADVRDLYRYTLVLHASDLPKGRGWSPHIWDILNGKNTLTVSLLNAENSVDTGDIWRKEKIFLSGDELYNEINNKLFLAELELMTWACMNIDSAIAEPQTGDILHYHPKRSPVDSQLNPDESIASQFNLLRVCDPERFPAYVVIKNQKYYLRIEKADD